MTQKSEASGATSLSSAGEQEGALSPEEQKKEKQLGLLAAFAAYGLWGMLVLYYAWLAHVPSLEVVANRVTWSLVVLGGFFLLRGRWGEVWAVFRDRRTLLLLVLSSLLISVNWLTYIWAVSVGEATQASLGYFILPLVNVAFGYVFLSERLTRPQQVAIGLAAFAILMQVVALGEIPYIALVLSLTFGSYGYIRKTISVGPNLGLLVELVLIAPFAVGYVLYLQGTGVGHLSLDDWWITGLLVFTGVATYFPLLWFAAAARRLQLSTVGVLQYINPTLQFLLAVFVLGEQLSLSKFATFALIWLSVGIYSYDAFRQAKKAQTLDGK